MGFALKYDEAKNEIVIDGCGGIIPVFSAKLDLGNSGVSYRFLTAACCLGSGTYELDGVERMRQRPIGQLVEALHQLGAHISYLGTSDYPPLRIEAKGLRGGEILMPPTFSSQYISALLLIAPYCEKGVTLRFDGQVTSQSYVEMTLGLMARFGVNAKVDEGFTRVEVAPAMGKDAKPRAAGEEGNASGPGYRGTAYAIEPDASNASYFLAAGAVVPGSKCTVKGLGRGSIQGDVGFADVLHQMGAGLVFGGDFITVMAPPDGKPLRGIDVDLNAIPDMVQTLAVVALFAQGPTTIHYNVGNMRIKETDRIAALYAELTKLGAAVEVGDGVLTIEPPADGVIKPAAIDTYNDHRMAMSFAIAGLRAPGIVINDPACVEKTFPEFFEYLGRLGTKA